MGLSIRWQALHLSTLKLRLVRLQANHRMRSESETYDIYLLPPGEDPETCQSWLRMRNRDGRYNLMFEEWVTDGPFIISPRITFEVNSALSITQLAAGAVVALCHVQLICCPAVRPCQQCVTPALPTLQC